MATVALLAFGLAALKRPTNLWANFTFTLALASVFALSLGTLARRGHDHRIWRAAALAVGCYLLLAFGPWFSSEVRPHLLTSSLLEAAYSWIHSVPAMAGSQRGVAMLHVIGGNGALSVESGDHFHWLRGAEEQINFERIGHSLTSLVCGLAGAALAGVLSPQRRRVAAEGEVRAE